MNTNSPFSSQKFKACFEEAKQGWDKDSVVLTKGSIYAHFGDLEIELQMHTKIRSEKKRGSGEWIGDP